MSSVTRTIFYRELWAGLFSPSRYVAFSAYFAISSASLATALQLGEGKFWTLQALWTLSVALPLPLLASLLTMPLFASERSAGTFELMELLPIPLRKVVIGKFAATFLSLCLAIAGSFVPWALLTHTLGARAPANAALNAPIAILFLHAFSWTALGTLGSALSRRPWAAAAGTLLAGGAAMVAWAAISQYFLDGVSSTTPYPIVTELLDASAGRIALHTFVFHIVAGLWCLFLAVQFLEARR